MNIHEAFARSPFTKVQTLADNKRDILCIIERTYIPSEQSEEYTFHYITTFLQGQIVPKVYITSASLQKALEESGYFPAMHIQGIEWQPVK